MPELPLGCRTLVQQGLRYTLCSSEGLPGAATAHKRAGFVVEVHAGLDLVGRARLEELQVGNRRMLAVSTINVERKLHRKGIGTKIREMAAEKACELGLQLVSDGERSEFEEAFWRKQRTKGRASCIRPNPKGAVGKNYYRYPAVELEESIRERCTQKFHNGRKVEACVKRELREIQKGLPKPVRTGEPGERYWPCYRFGLKRSQCKEARGGRVALDGAAPVKVPRKKKVQVKG